MESVSDGTLFDHVLHSSAIEGICLRRPSAHQRKDNPRIARRWERKLRYFTQHLESARFVAEDPEQALANPAAVHRLLFRDLMPHAGCFRGSGSMMVGDREMPRFERVPALMEQWALFARAMLIRPPGASSIRRARDALSVHHFFLCVHPFEDGNGRTARLLLNAARLQLGLPWMVIYVQNAPAYYSDIEGYEDTLFRPFMLNEARG